MKNSNSIKLSNRLRQVDSCGISATRKGNIPTFWKSAKGSNILDVDGNTLIDCTSCFGVLGIGHSHPVLVDSIIDQVSALSHVMCEINPYEVYLLALEKIKKAVGRQENSQVLLTTSGSEAIEVALKLSYAYTKKPGVISFYGAFHGQSLGALSVTSHNCFRDPFFPLIPNNVTFVPYPNSYRCNKGNDDELLKATIDQLNEIVSGEISGGLPIGSVIVEPMQNASGYIVPPKGFLAQLRKFCDEKNILLITDEIFTGFGRCGKWLASDYDGIIADITCVGKIMGGGLPSAACIASSKIMEAIDYEGLVPLHGSTFQGNPLSCRSIISTIEILEQESLLQKSFDNGEFLRKELSEILKNVDVVGDIRGMGSASVIEFVSDKSNKERNAPEAIRFNQFLLSNNIYTLITGVPFGNCVAFCPPFNMPKENFTHIFDICTKYVKTI
ncbi:aspartate aminotransferase family protein [Dysgonomonas sp. 521]|uniref:class-III pyridoxal-phosphate-dependent aminotransferase n=1 Tax=Dysgonomonas sp. 521 TaxID=2302932 RepID=UPI0013CF63BF|nr:aspartate aminotransferase family protein [Dysgonomonas sp. 521]NDV96784.1 aspartate aminotransferase family protein [Dysgonomonas sp. 521]